MSRPIEKTIEILNPVFPSGDVLVVAGSREFWAAQLKIRGIPEALAGPSHSAEHCVLGHYGNRLTVVVQLPAADFSIDWYGSLAHETSHLVDRLLERVGTTDTETRAYLQDFYTRTILGGLLGIRPRTFKERHFTKEKK